MRVEPSCDFAVTLLFHDKNESVTGVETIAYSIMTNVRDAAVRCISLPHMRDYYRRVC